MRYMIRHAWRNMIESWRVVFQTLFMMTVCLLILGAFGFVALQTQNVLKHWESEAPIIVYLKDNLDKKKTGKLLEYLKSLNEVHKVKWVSSRESMKRLGKGLGDKGKIIQELDVSLLPNTIEVELANHSKKTPVILRLQKQFSQLKGVLEVDAGSQWMAPLWKMASWLRTILWGGGALLLLCTSFMAASTIRWSLLLHRKEIEIMRLVGATERFIRAPFYAESIFEGGLSACFALLTLYGTYMILWSHYNGAFVAFTSLPMSFFPVLYMVLFVFGGVIAGFLGCWIALRTHID